MRAFFANHSFPLVEGDTITFVWRGDAQEVKLHHWVFGLESAQHLTRIERTSVWYLCMPLPPASRVEYKFEIIHDGHGRWIHDPLNPHLARDPYGANSVAHGNGYKVPEWIHPDPSLPFGRYEMVYGDPVFIESNDTEAENRLRAALDAVETEAQSRLYPGVVKL